MTSKTILLRGRRHYSEEDDITPLQNVCLGLRSEGSGVEFPINTLAGDIDEGDLISPTRLINKLIYLLIN